MLLYDNPTAPHPRIVRLFLAEKQIEVPRQEIDLAKRENEQPWFLALNPLGRVPVLVLDDGTAVAETLAICRYFECEQPEPPLFGRDAREQALVSMWQRRAELEVARPIMFAFRHTHPWGADREPRQVPEWGEMCRERALKRLDWFDIELGRRPWLAGEMPSVADLTLLVGLDFGRVIGLKVDAERWPRLARWHASMRQRPSAGA